jgi:hypothetical protein
MSSPSDDLPKSPWTRFGIGFSVAAFFTFFSVFLYGGGSKVEFLEAFTAAVVCGFAVGVLSAFGKKWLSFLIELFARFSF